MEKTLNKPDKMHLGKNIARIRELKGMKQEALADQLGVTQQMVSKIEQSENIEDEKLDEIAKALGVTTETIKKFNEEAAVNYVNTFNDNSSGSFGPLNYQCHFNPLDKVVELYERLLASEREKTELLKEKEKNKE